LQRYVASPAQHDYRVFVIGGKAMYAMSRHSKHWIHNVAQGATCKLEVLTPALKRMAEKAVKAIGLEYAGVDVMQDEHGQLTVLEVNGVPAWRGLQSVVQDDIALALARDVVQRKLKLPVHALQKQGASAC
jgi:tetrahydromethanopterin:alpha-L-glutamate ligase